MLTPLQTRKLTAMFHYYDLNGDGVLEKDDYVEFARRACQALGIPPGSPAYDQVFSATVDDWDNERLKRFDQDGDGKVSLAEHLAAHEAMLDDAALFKKVTMDSSQALLGFWDQDGDGKLSSAEYVKALSCYGVSQKAAEQAFQHLDRDGTGYLTVQEILEDINEFYYSDDPDAPGNWLMGPY